MSSGCMKDSTVCPEQRGECYKRGLQSAPVVATSAVKRQTQHTFEFLMPTPYTAKAIANYFLKHRKRFKRKGPITQMKLHKLVYFAHGWHLALKGEPLIDETLQAWDYGPGRSVSLPRVQAFP